MKESCFTQYVTFVDRGGMSWYATIDYGDNSGPQTLAVAEYGHFELSHRYLDNGTYTITVELVNDDGMSDQRSVHGHRVEPGSGDPGSIAAPVDPQPVMIRDQYVCHIHGSRHPRHARCPMELGGWHGVRRQLCPRKTARAR